MLHCLGRFFLAAVVVLVALSVRADDASDKAIIREMLQQFLAGVDQPEAHQKFWAEDLVYTSSRGTRTDKASIMAGLNEATSHVPSSDTTPVRYLAENVDIRVYDESAILAFTLVALQENDESQRGVTEKFLNTGMLVKRFGRWVVVAWQATKIPMT